MDIVSPLKWLANYLGLFVVGAFWAFGSVTIGTGDFKPAEYLFACGNLILIWVIVSSPRIDYEGYRPLIIFTALLIIVSVSTIEWFWIEGLRAMAITNRPIALITPSTSPNSEGSGGTSLGGPSTRTGILLPNAGPNPLPDKSTAQTQRTQRYKPDEITASELVRIQGLSDVVLEELGRTSTDRLLIEWRKYHAGDLHLVYERGRLHPRTDNLIARDRAKLRSDLEHSAGPLLPKATAIRNELMLRLKDKNDEHVFPLADVIAHIDDVLEIYGVH